MRRCHQVALLAGLACSTWIMACNPFMSDLGRLNQPCFRDGTCRPGLHCAQDICVAVLPPDGGSDGDGGDGDPCEPGSVDCSASGLAGQGADADGDGWGECCDCDDQRAASRPLGTEIPYNGHDDDCDPATPDDDLDGDGFQASQSGGSDCDDGNAAIHPEAEEDCNGLDDDCDGQSDEDLVERACPLVAGVCQGSTTLCLADAGWSACDYGPDYEPEESSCDNRDNDCDGLTDEGVAILLTPEQAEQATDGIDNNCNGLIDEPGGLVVPLVNHPNMWIDAYEITVFENSDCTGARYGLASDDYPANWPTEGFPQVTLYACSLGGLLPSGHLSYARAKWACEAQGKRLCTRNQWENACNDGVNLDYPYSMVFVPGVCNDPLAGTGQVEPTGSHAQCTAGNGTFDMSGNLAEWIEPYCEDAPGTAATMGDKYACILCYDGEDCRACIPDLEDDEVVMKRQSMCYVRAQYKVCYQRAASEPYLGTRCCYDGP